MLSDASKRNQYDHGGLDNLNFKRRHYTNPSDLFRQHFGDIDLGDLFSDFSTTSRRRTFCRVPPDNHVRMRLSLKNVLTGSKMKIELERCIACEDCHGQGGAMSDRNCSTCNGSGMVVSQMGVNMIFQRTCPSCEGRGKEVTPCASCNEEGYTVVSEKISVNIPAGIDPMARLKLNGKGNEIFYGDKKIIGDAYLVIDYPQRSNGVYLNKGDIYTSINVPFNTIIGNKDISVDILECKTISLKLNANKPSGNEYRIKGAGIDENHDAFIKVFVDIPKNEIGEEDRKKLIKLMVNIYGNPDTSFKPTSIN